MANHPTIPRDCAQCGKPFQARVDSIEKGHGNYCSRNCLFDSRKTRVMVVCQQCGTTFETIPGRVHDPIRGKFCSQPCYRASRKGVYRKLSDDIIRAIRQRKAAGERTCDLAQKYGIHANTIRRIANGTRCGHVT